MNINGQPVVCSRQLFGDVDATYLKYFVNHNSFQGIAATVFYEMGNSEIRDRSVLDPLIASGKLVIVDLRDIVQDTYRGASRVVGSEANNAAQFLTHNDCVNRFRPLEPSWILSMDMDVLISYAW